MRSYLRKLFGANLRASTRSKRDHRFQPNFQPLQERLVPAFLPVVPLDPLPITLAHTSPTVRLINGDIHIDGTDADDTVELSYVNGEYLVHVTVIQGFDQVSSGNWWFKPSQVNGGDVFFNGFAGNDYFREKESYLPPSKALRVIGVGGAGNDVMFGSYKNDFLDGGTGNDDLNGGTANDTIFGQDGDDIIRGWSGNDSLFGGYGSDLIYGDSGKDRIEAGPDPGIITPTNGVYDGTNTVYGGADDDLIFGGSGTDHIRGEDGNDNINGLGGDDYIHGGAGNDSILGGDDSSPNALVGDAGNDSLYGGAGKDLLVGGGGNDWLYGFGGNDRLDGGSGFDHLYGGAGNDTLDGGGDDIRKDVLFGGAGADTFIEEWKYSPDHWYTADYHPPSGQEVMDFNAGEGDVIIHVDEY